MENEINGCLFVGKQGLFKIYCAFKVICIRSVHSIEVGEIVDVTSVKTSPNGYIVYEIDGEHYYHHHFILADIADK